MSTLSIRTNLMAQNAERNLTGHRDKLARSVRRLSSGLRVGQSADDAAGLAIRELMRADITGLHQGVRNASDAISLIQTADGALQIIDEKLIRMKELAEQAATGTYSPEQRLMINNEFQAMAAEIDRIANATDFNGVHLLNGNLSGAHDGGGLTSTGALKVHFGTGNDSAEDYYYVNIGDATCAGLGLAASEAGAIKFNIPPPSGASPTMPPSSSSPMTIQDYFALLGNGWNLTAENNTILFIPKGTTNISINNVGSFTTIAPPATGIRGDNDIQLFTTSGKHLSGTPLTDAVWNSSRVLPGGQSTDIDLNPALGFTSVQYDGSNINTGIVYDSTNPSSFDPDNPQFMTSTYNGMTIRYTGDSEQYDAIPNDISLHTWPDYEILTIDVATEDLIVYLPGAAPSFIRGAADGVGGPVGTIATQSNAQNMLETVGKAIVKKDAIRAHLGAMQNRLENTTSNLQIQAENLQAAESRISDVDVALEMTSFVRNQILTQASTAMLAQANSMPDMLVKLLE